MKLSYPIKKSNSNKTIKNNQIMKLNSLRHKIYNTILTDIKNRDTDMADVLLLKMGYDLDKINQMCEQIDRSQLFIIKTTINKQKEQQLMEQASVKIKELLEKNLERPIAYLKELFENNEIVFQHNKLEKLDVEEIKEMIKDMNYLELLERLEKENEEEQ